MNKLQRLGIFGAGNVGSELIMQLAARDLADEVIVAARNSLQSEAAVLDAGSAYPEVASTFKVADHLEGAFDVIMITAGAKPHGFMSQQELLQTNVEIVVSAMQQATCQKLVVIGTPVDTVAEKIANITQFQDMQVIGFGGQLDAARTMYALLKRGIKISSPVYAIGEHGPRTIPVYDGEEAYETIHEEVGGFLGRIKQAGEPRNLATGVQLARLIEALTGEESTLCVSALDDDFDGLSITWPYVVNQSGLSSKVAIPALGSKATALLDELVQTRHSEHQP